MSYKEAFFLCLSFAAYVKNSSHIFQRCNRVACIGTMQFKGLGFPNKHFATQKCFCIDKNIACYRCETF